MSEVKHMKLVGGSLNTAKHDREKMDTARKAVLETIKEEKERSKLRKKSNDFEDILAENEL